jgi:DNA repair exonuclease SbcCD nuclease subunit
MKVAILHLSDIHIQDSEDWILEKHQKIAQSVLGTWENLDTIFIIISGDIANKGLKQQYILAQNFFTKIKQYIQEQSGAEVYFIATPGNHDCDFSGKQFDSKARKSFIDTIIRNPLEIEKGDSIYNGCLSVQQNFFSFIKELETKVEYPEKPEVFYQIKLIRNNQKFYFNIFNTAWLSQLHENQGGLVFPTHLAVRNYSSISLVKQ